MTKHLPMILALILVLSGLCDVAWAQPGETFPLSPQPERRAEQLNLPERQLRLNLAEQLHQLQAQCLTAAASSKQPNFMAFPQAAVFALEEYYEMELSYPETAAQLNQSGYLDQQWGEWGYKVVDFGQPTDEKTLAYVPEPVGVVDLICTPLRGCAVKMRCFSEFTLLCNRDNIEHFDAGGIMLGARWIAEYLDFNYAEVAYISKRNPAIGGSVAWEYIVSAP